MIRLTSNSLIIEINTENHSPLNVLQQLQTGLFDMLSICAVASDAPIPALQNSLQQIHKLLSEMNLCERQMDGIFESLNDNPELNKLFIKK